MGVNDELKDVVVVDVVVFCVCVAVGELAVLCIGFSM